MTASERIIRDSYGREAPASVDGVDLQAADECPACLDRDAGQTEGPAGYYQCLNCWSTWTGDYNDARIYDYSGPAVTGDDGD